MRVILVSVGTDGDVFPYVGLGAVMRSREHQVTLVASAHYESLARAHGFAFAALVSAEENHRLFGHPDFWNPLKTAPLMARWGLRFIERQYQLLAKLVIDNTILVASPGVLAAGLVHEKQGCPAGEPGSPALDDPQLNRAGDHAGFDVSSPCPSAGLEDLLARSRRWR